MTDIEQQPLLKDEKVDDIPSHPPPKYEPLTKDAEPAPPKYAPAEPMPLPTYEQSEKYETEGVLEYEREEFQAATRQVESEEEGERVSDNYRGSCCEFTFFFLFCVVLSLFGFVISLCVATTVAAQSGAITGLGVSFIAKSIVFEVYGVEPNVKIYRGYCNTYFGSSGDSVDQCVQRAFYITRVTFWIVGVFGLFLLYRGLSNFLRTRAARRN